jgi:hypothetical protein
LATANWTSALLPATTELHVCMDPPDAAAAVGTIFDHFYPGFYSCIFSIQDSSGLKTKITLISVLFIKSLKVWI